VDQKAKFYADVSNGEVVTNVVMQILFDKETEVVIYPNGASDTKLVTFNTMHCGDMKIGDDSRFLGSIVAPSAKVVIQQHVSFKGSVCAEKVDVNKDVTFLPHTSSTLLPKSPTWIDPTPADYSLDQNYPNPFNPSTMISYSTPEAVDVKIVVFDALGREVNTLVNGVQNTGHHSVVWDGTNSSGQHVPSGTYFYRITAGKFSSVKRMILSK